ncbi:MAG: type II toxin-antitoxin system RelE/ParE family toxin [Salegentibacter sp.]
MKIIWSHLAEKSYNSNLLYLSENWPLTVVQDFILEVEKVMRLLADNPEVFRWWDYEKKYKIAYVTSQISFFYSFDKEKIMIHLFWDKRQEPEKLEELLK